MRPSPRLLAVALASFAIWAFILTPNALGQSRHQPASARHEGRTAAKDCTIVGNGRDQLLKGTPKRDVICAMGGNDEIRGRNGHDVLRGGPGRDMVFGGDGNDTLDGGKNSDKCKQGTGHGKRIRCDGDRTGGGGGGRHNPLKVCPVKHGTVYDDFGDPRGDHKHQGNDIIAKKGEKVRATFPGEMENLKDSGAGRYVKLSGKDGFTYGMHLSKYAKERRVKTGDVIGYVGSTGNAGNTNHLHFEWHPGNGKAVDPFPRLKKVCSNTARLPISRSPLSPVF